MSGLSHFNVGDFHFIGLCLEGFFYGIYSGIFAMYLKYHYSKQSADYHTTNISFYSLCTLYVLSIVQITLDLTDEFLPVQAAIWHYNLSVMTVVISGCCDFIAQSILIYRCWIVWNRNIRVVIIPSILALIFLGLWVTPTCCASSLIETSLGMSLTVNALMTSLIVLKIFKVYSAAKPLYSQTFGPTSGGRKFRPILFVIIESGMALFAVQLTRLVVTILWTNTAIEADLIMEYVQQMFNGITPTIIQVRVSMGLSFHDEPSLEEVISSLHFGSNLRNSTSGTGSHGIVDEENRDDGIGTQCLGSNDIVYQDENIVGVQPSNDDSDIVEVERDDHLS